MSEPALFHKVADEEAARLLFKRHVQAVELETFSYCNRTCNYCPNAFIDRLSENKFLNPETYARLLGDLGSIDYSGFLTLSHYNEPLSDRRILDHIRRAKLTVPSATVQIFSNGDYLNEKYLEALVGAGLNALHLSIHLANTATYDELKIFDRIAEMSVRLGIAARHKHFFSGRSIEAEFPHKSIAIRIFEADYANIGGNRGGLLRHIESPERTSPCAYPFNTLTIAHNGYVVPCCQLRADTPEHHKYRVGHVDDFSSIFSLYANSSLVGWRRGLYAFGPKQTPCDTCNQACMNATPDQIAARQKSAMEFGLIEEEAVAEMESA